MQIRSKFLISRSMVGELEAEAFVLTSEATGGVVYSWSADSSLSLSSGTTRERKSVVSLDLFNEHERGVRISWPIVRLDANNISE